VNVNRDFGVFAQDRWTVNRWTLSGGVRFDQFVNSFPEQGISGTFFGHALNANFPKLDSLNWKDITPKLGAYFGTTDGVLVVSAPDNAAFKLEDGDVIQAIDGRKPDDGPHALRILRSYKSGEKLSLSVLRQRKPLSLAVTMPDRPDFDEQFGFGVPAEPPMPAVPAMPSVPPGPTRAPMPPPGAPGGAST